MVTQPKAIALLKPSCFIDGGKIAVIQLKNVNPGKRSQIHFQSVYIASYYTPQAPCMNFIANNPDLTYWEIMKAYPTTGKIIGIHFFNLLGDFC